MLEFVKLILDEQCGHYHPTGGFYASSIGMGVLGLFLTEDVTDDAVGFKEWALDEHMDFTSSNATCLEKVVGGIYLFDGTEEISEQSRAHGIKLSLIQFLKLMDDWDEKVWKAKPKEVIIKHENDHFIIETID